MTRTRTPARPGTPLVRCAIYTRKSTDEGLEQEFNSLDAQREAAEAFVTSQAGEGWRVPGRADLAILEVVVEQHGLVATDADVLRILRGQASFLGVNRS